MSMSVSAGPATPALKEGAAGHFRITDTNTGTDEEKQARRRCCSTSFKAVVQNECPAAAGSRSLAAAGTGIDVVSAHDHKKGPQSLESPGESAPTSGGDNIRNLGRVLDQ